MKTEVLNGAKHEMIKGKRKKEIKKNSIKRERERECEDKMKKKED